MFYSILFPTQEQHKRPRRQNEPPYFKDLNLDQVFDPILTEEKGFGLKEKRDFGLESIFYTPLDDPDVIAYRQDVMRELENDGPRGLIAGFADTINGIGNVTGTIRDALMSTEKWQDNYLTRGQLLDCAEKYCRATVMFSRSLSAAVLSSAGLRGFSEYLAAYVQSDGFQAMNERAKGLREKFSTVQFCMLVKGGTIRVRPFEEQPDIAKDILATFAKFGKDDGGDYSIHVQQPPQDIRMEATILNMVAGFNKDIFGDLDSFCAKYFNFEDETLLRFTREVQFYLLWLEFIAPMRRNGLSFCYPKLCRTPDDLYCRGGFDLSLAYSIGAQRHTIVPNDFELRAPERILVVTGPNQGGKTTFARAFGQIHHLASLGLCVPGSGAALYLFDSILTHFGREEDLATLNGKLQEDLVRLRDMLKAATGRSIIIVNEIFASTTLTDAVSLGKRMMDALAELGAPAVIVTFLDELAGHGPETVSMMSTVDKEDASRRTFQIVRKPPDGLAYAMSLTKKHRLTYEQLNGRLKK